MQQLSPHETNKAEALAAAMESQCLGVRVGRLQRLVGRRFDRELRPLGLSIPQLEVLSALVLCAAPVKPSDLAGWLCIERSTMSRNLALLEQRGLVETTERSPTGRSLRVTITDGGAATLAEAEKAWTTAQEALRDVIGNDAAATLDTWIAALTPGD